MAAAVDRCGAWNRPGVRSFPSAIAKPSRSDGCADRNRRPPHGVSRTETFVVIARFRRRRTTTTVRVASRTRHWRGVVASRGVSARSGPARTFTFRLRARGSVGLVRRQWPRYRILLSWRVADKTRGTLDCGVRRGSGSVALSSGRII